jgi:hypothetical protein
VGLGFLAFLDFLGGGGGQEGGSTPTILQYASFASLKRLTAARSGAKSAPGLDARLYASSTLSGAALYSSRAACSANMRGFRSGPPFWHHCRGPLLLMYRKLRPASREKRRARSLVLALTLRLS